MSPSEIEKIQYLKTEEEKYQFLKKRKKLRKVLFTLVGENISIFNVKLKEKINLNSAFITKYEQSDSLKTPKNEFKFKITKQKNKTQQEDQCQYKELCMGCDSESACNEWICNLSIIQNCDGKFNMRQSVQYLDQVRKIQIINEGVNGTLH